MISEWQVLGWLNRYNPTRLSLNHVQDLENLHSLYLPEKIYSSGLNQLISYVRASNNRMERAEIRLHCGLLCYSHNQPLDAGELLEEAQAEYEGIDTHRQAIAKILLYIFYNGQEERLKALYWARKARADLWKMVMFSIQQKDAVSETWYKERVYELTSDLFQSPRYVFELIFDLQSSRFCAAASMIKEKIEELLKNQYEQDVCDKLNRLLNIVQNSTVNEEKAEALVYCGLVNAEIQDTNAAANYLRQGLVYYLPGTHEYVMARWILGLILAPDPKFTAEMEKHMQACERFTKVLKERADHQNLPVPCRWYDITGEAMRRVHRKLAANPA